MKQVRLAQAIALIVYGHDEAPHPIAHTLTRGEIDAADARNVTEFISNRAADEFSERELGRLDLGGEAG
jgi:hypothetical protein